MKKPLLVFLFLFPALGTLHANPAFAEHYLSKAPQYLGKQIQVQVAYLTSYSAGPENKQNGVWFNAITASGSKSGGLIAIRVKSQDAQNFLKKYGQQVQNDSKGGMVTQPLSGLFSKTKLGKPYIDCTGN